MSVLPICDPLQVLVLRRSAACELEGGSVRRRGRKPLESDSDAVHSRLRYAALRHCAVDSPLSFSRFLFPPLCTLSLSFASILQSLDNEAYCKCKIRSIYAKQSSSKCYKNGGELTNLELINNAYADLGLEFCHSFCITAVFVGADMGWRWRPSPPCRLSSILLAMSSARRSTPRRCLGAPQLLPHVNCWTNSSIN